MKPDFVLHVPGKHEEGMNLVIVEVKHADEFLYVSPEDFRNPRKSLFNLGYCVSQAHYHRGVLLVFSADKHDLSSERIREQVSIVEDASKAYGNRIEAFWHNGPDGGLHRLTSAPTNQ